MKNSAKIRKFIKFMHSDCRNISALFFIFFLNFIIFLIFYGNTLIFSDFSRELYIPAAMNEGSVLYKDIFNVYAPLGYQLNALLVSFFGVNLRTFYAAGFINSVLILFALFLILRLFIRKRIILSTGIVILIITSCIYAVSQTNYITPYSYSMVYALNSFLWALTALLYFIKYDKKYFLYLSFLMFGASISFKYEFIPFIFILSIVIIYKKENVKTVLCCILALFFIPLLSTADLFIKGVSLYDLKQALNYMIMLSKAESVKVLYTYLGFIPSIASVKLLLVNFLETLTFILALSLMFFCALKKINIILKVLLTAALIYTIYYLVNIFIISNAFYFNWIGVFAFVLYIIFCIKFIKKRPRELTDKLFFVLFTTTVLCSFKCIFNISFNSYGTYYFPLLFISCILYFYNYRRMRKIKIFLLSIFIIYTLAIIYGLSNTARAQIVFVHNPVKTEKSRWGGGKTCNRTK